MISLLQEYLNINTAHPNPDYGSVVALFTARAKADGFLSAQFTLPSRNPVLVITLPGSSSELPALALNHHMDVVPANNASEWLFPPFAGKIHKGMIYGRGTQDCKGLGVVQYTALKRLKQTGPRPQRTTHLLIVPDEERGGFHGTKEFLEHPKFRSLNIGYLLDEGIPSGNEHELVIKINERTPIQIRVTSCGKQGHASISQHNCVHTLIRCLSELLAVVNRTSASFPEQGGDRLSAQITSLTTNTQEHTLNVIPSRAEATLDIRIPPSISLDYGISLIDSVVNNYEHNTYEILATSYERCKPISQSSFFYQTLAQAVQEQQLVPKDYVFEATTDARFYSHRGIETLGCTPFCIAPNLHGTNEAVRVKDLINGSNVLYTFLRTFCN